MKRLIVISLIVLASLVLSACSTGASATSWPGLAADTNNAYLANGGTVYAVRLADGVKVWQYPADKPGTEQFHSNPVLTPDGQVLVGSSGRDYALYSLDAATGNPKWAKPFTTNDQWVASPLVVGDTVYAPNNNGTLYALKLATGELDWSLAISHSLWGTPATDGKLLFLTSLDHHVYAVDLQTHQFAWPKPRDLGGSVASAPLVAADGSALYIGSFSRKFFALNPKTGQDIWSTPLLDWAWNTPILIDKNLYTADISGNLYALSADTGQKAWAELKPDTAITASPVAIPGGVLVATQSGHIYAYKADRTEFWKTENNEDVKSIGGQIYTTPILAGDRVLVAPMSGKYLLYALNSQDGKLLWHFDGK